MIARDENGNTIITGVSTLQVGGLVFAMNADSTVHSEEVRRVMGPDMYDRFLSYMVGQTYTENGYFARDIKNLTGRIGQWNRAGFRKLPISARNLTNT